MKKINTFILTGFLGSGKTTLLNKLLHEFKGENNIVIENEFGKINVDKNLITSHYDAIHEITNGCICCSNEGELLNLLSRIAFTGNRPDNIFVECTGIADVNKISAIFKMADFPEVYDLRPIICLIDCSSILRFINDQLEVSIQIIGSDWLCLNRDEEMELNKVQELEETLLSINPYAKIKSQDLITKHSLMQEIIIERDFNQEVISKENPHKINNILFEEEELCDLSILNQVLTSIKYFYSDTFYRIKGYVIDTDRKIHLIQYTPGSFKISPSNHQKEKSQIVFIGKALERKGIDRLMRSCFNKKIITTI
jgi:G3E family GTPase